MCYIRQQQMSTSASPLCTLALGRWILSPPQFHLCLSVQLSRNVNSIVSLSYLFQDFIILVLKKVSELSPKFCKWRPEMIVAEERLSSNMFKVTLHIVRWGIDSLLCLLFVRVNSINSFSNFTESPFSPPNLYYSAFHHSCCYTLLLFF